MPISETPVKHTVTALEPLGGYPGDFSAHTFENIVVFTWHGVTTLESMPTFEALTTQFRQRFERGFSVVHLITSGHPRMPDAATRDELVRIQKRHEDVAACCAVVIPVQGFVGSALRGLVTAIVLRTQRTHVELKIVGTVEAAAEWLTPLHNAKLGLQVDASQLLAALRQAATPH